MSRIWSTIGNSRDNFLFGNICSVQSFWEHKQNQSVLKLSKTSLTGGESVEIIMGAIKSFPFCQEIPVYQPKLQKVFTMKLFW